MSVCVCGRRSEGACLCVCVCVQIDRETKVTNANLRA